VKEGLLNTHTNFNVLHSVHSVVCTVVTHTKLKTFKADSHIHAVLLRVSIVSFPFDLHSGAVFDSYIPWHGMCESALCVNQTWLHCVNQMGKPLAEWYGRGMAWYV
jgi:hypothetical protein